MTFKKFIAAILLFTLILQSFPVTVYASEKDDDDSNSSNTETVYYEEEDLGYSPYPDASWVQNPNSGITWDEYFGGVANTGLYGSWLIYSSHSSYAEISAHSVQ